MSNSSATGGFLTPRPVQFTEDDKLDALLRGLVSGVTPLPGNLVRTSWQTEAPVTPPLGTNWCSIAVTTEVEDQYGYVTMNASQVFTARQHDTVEVLANFYGPAARSNAKLLKIGLLIGQNLETLQNAGMAMLSVGDLIILPDLRNERYLYRVDLPLRFRRASIIQYNVETVESFVGTLIAEEGFKDYTYDLSAKES